MFYQLARAFGRFQNMLRDFSAEQLFETIERFHDTVDRYRKFKEAISADKASHLASVKDELDLSKVNMYLNLFEAYTKGYLEEFGNKITAKEAELLSMSANLMTLECEVRFLTDYLDGDNYFRIHRPDHNFDRARTQFKLVADMEEKMGKMSEIVSKYFAK